LEGLTGCPRRKRMFCSKCKNWGNHNSRSCKGMAEPGNDGQVQDESNFYGVINVVCVFLYDSMGCLDGYVCMHGCVSVMLYVCATTDTTTVKCTGADYLSFSVLLH
jgi:hypothetical protein